MRYCKACLKVVRAEVKKQIAERETPLNVVKINEHKDRKSLPWHGHPDTNNRWERE